MDPRRISLYLCFCFIAFTAASQTRITDSLEAILRTQKDDTLKARVLDDLCWEYNQIDVKKSEQFARQLVNLSKKIGYRRGEGNGFANLGAVNYLQSNYDSAVVCFKNAVAVRKQISDLAGAGGALNNIAMALQKQSNYSQAVSFYLQALKLFETLKDEKRTAQANVNVSSIYTELKNYTLAIEYATRGLAGWQKVGSKPGISGAYVNLGNNYHGMNNFKEAIRYYEMALELQKEVGNSYTIGRIYHNLGTAYTLAKNYKKAAEYLGLEIPLKEQAGDKEGLSTAYHSLGQLYLKTGKTDLAIDAAHKALEIAKSTGSKDNMKFAFISLKEAYWAKGKYDLALTYDAYHDLMQDTLYSESSSRQIAEMQTRYETEKKERENLELRRKTEIQELELKNETEKRKNMMMLGVSLFGLTGASAFFLYNRKKLKEKALHAADLANEEKKRFTAMIEAEEKERSRIAQELHDGLGQMLSTARLNVAGLEETVPEEEKQWLGKSLKLIDNACAEVRNISHNMMPGALIRLGLIPAVEEMVDQINASRTLKIEFTSETPGTFPKNHEINIYRIFQEVLNNMIRHSQATVITISMKHKNNEFELLMRDNGVGFDTSAIKESKGMGWKNIYSRASMMSGVVDVDSQAGKGTNICIRLKI